MRHVRLSILAGTAVALVMAAATAAGHTRGKSPSCGAASELANLMAEWLP